MQNKFFWLVVLGLLILAGWLFFTQNPFRLKNSPKTQQVKVTPSPLSQQSQITINGSTLLLEVADTPEKQRQGLSGHAPLTDNQGMLFPYSPPQQVVFWMKGMTFPIDIIYISQGEVVQIYPNVPNPDPGTPDLKLKRYPSNQNLDYVLETQAGWVEKHDINVNDSVNLEL